jgi:DNA-binding response OmpR family regulator
MAAKVVVVEDEPTIAAAVADRLRADGYDVHVAADGPGGVALCAQVRPDVVVLDLMLPGFDGYEVCRRLQAERPVPVLMLTARDDETDVVAGLRMGADDYVTKPFSPRELSARVAALLRRTAYTGAADVLRLGDVEVDRASRRVRRAGETVHLTPTEFDLLARLAQRPGAVLTRDQLLADVWSWNGAAGTTRTVDSHVAALRRKLGDDVVRTVHGVGYAVGDLT